MNPPARRAQSSGSSDGAGLAQRQKGAPAGRHRPASAVHVHDVSVEAFVRAPKQERSRASFERAVDAAVALLVERRSDAFTLAEVAERAGVSIGSIYGRVDSKDDLLRAAHAREMARINDATVRAFGDLDISHGALGVAVTETIRTLARLLRADAAVLASFVALAQHDKTISETGKATYRAMVDSFRAALLTRRPDILHRDPERAVTWSCTVASSVLERWLEFGDAGEGAEESDWDTTITDLSEMVTAFLRGSTAT